jgi:hypothetical protein
VVRIGAPLRRGLKPESVICADDTISLLVRIGAPLRRGLKR